MAVSIAPSSLHSRNYVYTPRSSIKTFGGVRLQCPNSLGIEKSSISTGFRDTVFKSIQARPNNRKPARGRVIAMIGTPYVIYRDPVTRRGRWMDIWNYLYRERIIWLGQHITERASNFLLCTLLYLDTVDDTRKLYMFINCPGGDLTPALSIYDTMKSLQTPIGTHCIYEASNLAGFILAAGVKGSRTAWPTSMITIQGPAGNAYGQADRVKRETDELLRVKDYLFEEFAKNTGQPVKKVHKDLNRGMLFNSNSALEYGIIDRLVQKSKNI